MKLIKKYGLIIFWIVLIFDCLLSIINKQPLRIYTKSILMPILALYFFVNTNKSKHQNSKSLVYISILFAWLADLFLLQNDLNSSDMFLTIGICLLLAAFIIYGIMFRKMQSIDIKDCQEAFLSSVAVIILSVIFYSVLKRVPLGSYKYLFFVGVGIMTVVMAFAANIFKNKIRTNMATKYYIPGFITLIISMCIIMIHKFLIKEVDFMPAVIVLTYGFGQLLIIRGFTKYLKA